MEFNNLKDNVQETVEAHRNDLIALSQLIHKNPEGAFHEKHASIWLTDYLQKNNFQVEKNICGLSTAFKASYGEGQNVIAFLSEFDALPIIGHGCGHNIIGVAGVAAGIASKLLADTSDVKILVIGCPAEEAGGGKSILIKNGAFDEVDIAMIVHPVGSSENWTGMISAAGITVDVEFFGKESHAAVSPWDGANALQAMICSFNNVNMLMSGIKDRSRISGIIREGGKSVNVIPGYSSGLFSIRAHSDSYLDELCQKVIKCFEAAALSTGTRLVYKWIPGSKRHAIQNNSKMLNFWCTNLEILGRKPGELKTISGMSDVGDVSIIVPCIHPFISISDSYIPFHTSEFCEAARSDTGNQAIIDGAKALAMTAIDIIKNPNAISEIKDEFNDTIKNS